MEHLHVIAVPPIVGVTPRVGSELRNELRIPADNWLTFDPFEQTPKPAPYPFSVAVPLPGVQKRRQRIISSTDVWEKVEMLSGRVHTAREEHRNSLVMGVAWSIGAWFAGMVNEQYDEQHRFDALVLISPMLTMPLPDKKVKTGATVNSSAFTSPTLMLVAEEDEAIPDAVRMARRYEEACKPNIEVIVMKQGKHAFDQQKLRGGGRMTNPSYSSALTNQANAAIRRFLDRLSSKSS